MHILNTYVERFLRHLEAERNASSHTLQNYQADLRDFLSFLKDKNVLSVDYLDIRLVELADLLEIIRKKPAHTHLILTGRNAKKEIIDLADLVTEMKEIKHPFQKGITAQKGIDY